ncbi:MAG: hypothetical protein GXO36_05815 [Chloroflexi bacterium]|nr:hypothetical protein [Chloroflexota bacterium]
MFARIPKPGSRTAREENPPARPPLTLPAIGLGLAGLYMAFVHALRLELLWSQRDFWRSQPWRSPWWVQVGASALWMTVFLILAWGWLFRRSWARRGTQIAVIIYAAWYWFDRLVLADPSLLQAGTAFALGSTFVLVLLVFGLIRQA